MTYKNSSPDSRLPTPNSHSQALARIKANPLQQDCQQLCDLAALDAIPGFLVGLIEPDIKIAIAGNPKTAPNFLAQLAEDEDDDVREKVAGNSYTPGYALNRLAQDKNLDVRSALVKNPQTPGAALRQLADDIYETIRRAVVNHPNAPGKVVLQLQEFIPPYQRESRLRAAANKGNSEADDLEDLAKSDDWRVRLRVAENPLTPEDVLELLSMDEMIYVKVAVARNPIAPSHLLLRMAEDNTGQKYADGSVVPEVRIAVINNPNTPLSVIENLTRDLVELTRRKYNRGVVEAIASNPKTPLHILEKLAGDEFIQAYRIAMFRDLLEGEDNPYKEALAQTDEATAITDMETVRHLNSEEIDDDFYKSVLYIIVKSVERMAAEVRLLILKSPSIPDNFLERLLEQLLIDENQNISDAAKEIQLNLPTQVTAETLEEQIALPAATPEIRRAVAAYSETPVAVLKKLAADKDVEVRVNVASHPHITEDIIEILAQDVVLVKQALARNPLTPPRILEQLANNSLLRLAITENPQTPQKLRQRLLTQIIKYAEQLPTQEKIDTLTSIVINPHNPADIVTELVSEESSDMRAVFASNPLTPEYILKRLGKEKNLSVCSSLAGNPSTPEYILKLLAGHQDNWIKTQIAQNPNTPLDILEDMASRGECIIALCSNPRLPWSTLERLYTEKGSLFGVYTNLAGNPNTPPEILDQLAAPGRHESINKAVAANPHTRPETLERLAKDIYAQHVVAANPHTPPHTLAELVKNDRYKNISPIVAKNPSAPLEVLQTIPEWQEKQKLKTGVRAYLASHPDTPPGYLQSLALDEAQEVRVAVAGNIKSDRSILEIFVKDQSRAVRLAVAQNPSTPVDLLQVLVEDSETDVRLAAINHPQGLSLLLAGFVKSGVEFTRLVALLHPQTPETILREKLDSPHWWERWASLRGR